MTNTPTYQSWEGMKWRCLNPKAKCYHNYGGRGIGICKKWLKFEGFYEDMGEKPAGLSLDRIDNERGYSKSNCRWATRIQQNRNMRTVQFVTFKGERRPITEWAEMLGFQINTLKFRLKRGWSVERAMTEPRKQKMVNGKYAIRIYKPKHRGKTQRTRPNP